VSRSESTILLTGSLKLVGTAVIIDEAASTCQGQKVRFCKHVLYWQKCRNLLDWTLFYLCRIGSHFHPGRITEISPPDIYGILVDRERGNKPHIFSREEVLSQAVSVTLSLSLLSPLTSLSHFLAKKPYNFSRKQASSQSLFSKVIVRCRFHYCCRYFLPLALFVSYSYPTVIPYWKISR